MNEWLPGMPWPTGPVPPEPPGEFLPDMHTRYHVVLKKQT